MLKNMLLQGGAWAKPSDPDKKPWFCKNFQSGNCTHTGDHEFNGKLQKHICAFCLMGETIGSCRKRLHFQKTKFKKRHSSCPSLGRDSCSNGSHCEVRAKVCNSSAKCDGTYIVEKPRKNECKSSNEQTSRVEQGNVEVKDSIASGPGLNPSMVQNRDHNDLSNIPIIL